MHYGCGTIHTGDRVDTHPKEGVWTKHIKIDNSRITISLIKFTKFAGVRLILDSHYGLGVQPANGHHCNHGLVTHSTFTKLLC